MSTLLLSRPHRRHLLGTALLLSAATAQAAPITVTNHSFEDTTGLVAFNEFTFGVNPGWSLYDPNNVAVGGTGANGIFTGTLNVMPGSPWFNGNIATDGNLVAILFGFGASASAGAGEYGLEQTLADVLVANTTYELQVDVGNIAEGSTIDNSFFPLGGFPGYRVELLAGGVVIASDEDLLTIGEGEFATVSLSYTADALDPLLGQALGIRLVNRNQIPAGNDPQAPFDLEVDFDNVRLSATTAVPEPGLGGLVLTGLAGLVLLRRSVAGREPEPR